MSKARTFVLGDIHGAYRALRQCLERSAFDLEKDHLICLGDVCDGWPETDLCINQLLNLKHVSFIIGNHDLMMIRWVHNGAADESWLSQGGLATVNAYPEGVPDSHIKFIRDGLPYLLRDDRLFVHAGFVPTKSLDDQSLEVFCWDRTLAKKVLEAHRNADNARLTPFKEVYIGHTPIPFSAPINAGGVWMMDTGAGWTGTLSLMNVSTKEIYSSDVAAELYPGVQGRSHHH